MLTCLIPPTSGQEHVSSILMSNWHTQMINCHATRRRDWWPSCCTIWCGASDRPAFQSIPWIFLAHQSGRETLSFLLRSRNLLPLPPLKYKCLQCPRSLLSWCWAADTSWFLSATGQPGWPVRTSSLLWCFSSMYSTVLGVHHPVHSQLPQWGHFFRNTLQASIALGITKSRTVILDLLLQGNSVLSQPSELFICDQHWLKWL